MSETKFLQLPIDVLNIIIDMCYPDIFNLQCSSKFLNKLVRNYVDRRVNYVFPNRCRNGNDGCKKKVSRYEARNI